MKSNQTVVPQENPSTPHLPPENASQQPPSFINNFNFKPQPKGQPFQNHDDADPDHVLYTPIPSRSGYKRLGFSIALYLLLIPGIILVSLSWINRAQITESINTDSFTNLIFGEPTDEIVDNNPGIEVKLAQFASETEFREYLSKIDELTLMPGSSILSQTRQMNIAELGAPSSPESSITSQTPPSIDRYSLTNIQVTNIDEPDIVKTDGQHLFVSDDQINQPQPFIRPIIFLQDEPFAPDIEVPTPTQNQSLTRIINALPANQLSSQSSIDQIGQLLLTNNTLITIANSSITGYNVADRSNPQQLWQYIPDNQQVVTARLFNNNLYLVLQSSINYANPCPFPLMRLGSEQLSIPCTDIYYPPFPAPVDVVFSILKLDPVSGIVGHQSSIVGSSHESVVAMFNQGLYLSLVIPANPAELYANFIVDAAPNLLNQTFIDRINLVMTYDISDVAKLTEIMQILQAHQLSLSDDDKRLFETELSNRSSQFANKNLRNFEHTNIIKFSPTDLSITAKGQVPGRPLNQFSLDEHDNTVRIATTVDSNRFMFGEASENDVYILDSNLNQIGSVTGLGKEERIYSVRFMGDTGYVVTFRQIDPFYVLDLSNPQNPQLAGELKIPGFSSYLHPLPNDTILGVGQEGQRVKLSLFDVSNPQSPQEVSVYHLDERYSEVNSNHKAFMHDVNNSYFVIPAGRSAYIFSYQNNTLSLNKAIDKTGIRRSLYINEALYLIANRSIYTFSIGDWSPISQYSW